MIPTSDYTWQYAAIDLTGRLDRHALEHWLSPSEHAMFDRLRHPNRRAGWLAGRVLAKQVLLRRLGPCGQDVCRAAPARIAITTIGPSGSQVAPEIRLDGQPVPWSLSISHTDRGVLVVLAATKDDRIGVDLVAPSNYGAGFCELWFTDGERRWIGPGRPPLRVATLWAIKEATYKACHRGEPFDPRRIEVLPGPPGRYRLRFDRTAIVRFVRTWQLDRQVAAVIWGHRQETTCWQPETAAMRQAWPRYGGTGSTVAAE